MKRISGDKEKNLYDEKKKNSLVASITVLFQFCSNSFFVHMKNKFFYMSAVDSLLLTPLENVLGCQDGGLMFASILWRLRNIENNYIP